MVNVGNFWEHIIVHPQRTLTEDILNDKIIIVEARQVYENVMAAFCICVQNVWERYFNVIWILRPREKIASKWVAKRGNWAVFHFWILKELTDAKYFPSYPNVFRSWMEMTHSNDGHIKYVLFCMFLMEVSVSLRKNYDWEYRHYPWYLECEQWSVAFDNAEKNAFSKISSGTNPVLYFVKTKLGPKGGEGEAAIAIKSCLKMNSSLLDWSRGKKASVKKIVFDGMSTSKGSAYSWNCLLITM